MTDAEKLIEVMAHLRAINIVLEGIAAQAPTVQPTSELLRCCKEALEALEQLHGCTDSDDGTVEAITVWCPEVIESLRSAIANAESAAPTVQGCDVVPTLKDACDRGTHGCVWQHEPTPTPLERMADNAGETPSANPPAGNPIRLTAAPTVQPTEPVAWRTFDGEGGYDYRNYEDNERYRDEYIARNGPRYASWVEPLFAAPQPAAPTEQHRKPLTDEEIDDILWPSHQIMQDSAWYIREFARAIEKAHGIGGEHD
jgi:hypothetical protein